jgi:hypothetical protein
MELLSAQFGICWREPTSSYSMLVLAGQQQCILHCSHTPCAMPPFCLPVLEDGTSRLELFSSIWVGCSIKHVHTFACPVFALQNALASGKLLPRWSPRARLGLNLGLSPNHARKFTWYSVWLVGVYLLSTTVGLMTSLRWHVNVDLMFLTPFVGSN